MLKQHLMRQKMPHFFIRWFISSKLAFLFSLHSKWNIFADIPNHKLKQTQEKVDHH